MKKVEFKKKKDKDIPPPSKNISSKNEKSSAISTLNS